MGGWEEIVVAGLRLAASIATAAGQVVVAKRVEEIITSEFPRFAKEARSVADEVRDNLSGHGV